MRVCALIVPLGSTLLLTACYTNDSFVIHTIKCADFTFKLWMHKRSFIIPWKPVYFNSSLKKSHWAPSLAYKGVRKSTTFYRGPKKPIPPWERRDKFEFASAKSRKYKCSFLPSYLSLGCILEGQKVVHPTHRQTVIIIYNKQ